MATEDSRLSIDQYAAELAAATQASIDARDADAAMLAQDRIEILVNDHHALLLLAKAYQLLHAMALDD